jgi:hypothetical protein
MRRISPRHDRATSERRDALLAACYARDVVDVVRDGYEICFVLVQGHVFRHEVDLHAFERQCAGSMPWSVLISGTKDGVDPYHHYRVALSLTRANLSKHLVRHVPRDIAHRAGSGVAPYHGRTGNLECGERRVVRCVREVDEDSKAIEFVDERFAERTDAADLEPW